MNDGGIIYVAVVLFTKYSGKSSWDLEGLCICFSVEDSESICKYIALNNTKYLGQDLGRSLASELKKTVKNLKVPTRCWMSSSDQNYTTLEARKNDCGPNQRRWKSSHFS